MARSSGEDGGPPDTGPKLDMDGHPLIQRSSARSASLRVVPSMMPGWTGLLSAFRGGASPDRRPTRRVLGALPALAALPQLHSLPPFAADGAQIIPMSPATDGAGRPNVRADRRPISLRHRALHPWTPARQPLSHL